ncbi:MAG: hypothetical protein AAGG01_20315 [Planctomycetota bacterium]
MSAGPKYRCTECSEELQTFHSRQVMHCPCSSCVVAGGAERPYRRGPLELVEDPKQDDPEPEDQP